DGMDDLVAVHFLVLKQAEDEELGDAIHEVRIGFAGRHWRHYTLEFKVLQEECSGADSCGLRRDAPVLGWGPARHVWQKSDAGARRGCAMAVRGLVRLVTLSALGCCAVA